MADKGCRHFPRCKGLAARFPAGSARALARTFWIIALGRPAKPRDDIDVRGGEFSRHGSAAICTSAFASA